MIIDIYCPYCESNNTKLYIDDGMLVKKSNDLLFFCINCKQIFSNKEIKKVK